MKGKIVIRISEADVPFPVTYRILEYSNKEAKIVKIETGEIFTIPTHRFGNRYTIIDDE